MTMTQTPDAFQTPIASPAVALARLRLPLAARIILAVVLVLTLWALAVATFGYPALILPLTVIVPSFFLLLVVITWA